MHASPVRIILEEGGEGGGIFLSFPAKSGFARYPSHEKRKKFVCRVPS